MAPKVCASTAILLSLNLFLAVVTATPCSSPPVKPPPLKLPPLKRPPVKGPPITPPASCPRDVLKLGECGNVLNLLKLKIGVPPKYPCCSLLEGLIDLEAAVCLCTAFKANVLGIHVTLPIDLTLLLNYCGKTVPYGFKCA